MPQSTCTDALIHPPRADLHQALAWLDALDTDRADLPPPALSLGTCL